MKLYFSPIILGSLVFFTAWGKKAGLSSLALADLDGDGKFDIIREYSDDKFYWNRNQLYTSNYYQWNGYGYQLKSNTYGSFAERRILYPDEPIVFEDANFVAALHNQIANGYLWISNYSGVDHVFKPSDFENIEWLSFDNEEGSIYSIADLKWFPNLISLHIWDASQITDFTPIWELSELRYLSINGARGADLSGISSLSALEILDLDDNQLSDLSILDNLLNLQQLYLVGNHLDLGDSTTASKITELSNLIYTNRINAGWGYYESGIDYEPQYPAAFRDLTYEIYRVDQILSASPNDAEANLLRGVYTLINIFESNEVEGLKEFAVSVGVDPAIRTFLLSDLSSLESYDAELNSLFQLGELAQLMEDSIIPSLEIADSYFARVPASSVAELGQETTGSESLVYVDYADVLVLRTITNLLAGLASLQSGYDWDINAGYMESLDDSDNMTLEQIRDHNPNFGGIRNTNQLAKAKVFLQTAIDLYQEASPLLTDYNRWGVENRLFVLSQEDLADEAEFRDALLDLESSFEGPHLMGDEADERRDTFDLSRVFAGNVDLAQILPENKKNKFITDQLDDPTIGGLFPGFTQGRISEEIEDANLLWDDRAIVFWREELVSETPYAGISSSKRSVILRYLGDGSEEVLYSVNTTDLINQLGLSSTTTYNLQIEGSKVCISPEGDRLIFGFSLASAPMGYIPNQRHLTQIISYDLVQRSNSVIRSWVASNPSDSMNIDYVNFCTGALAVDWANEKIYFVEQSFSDGSATYSVNFEKLVSCDFSGQGLTAVKKFDSFGTSSPEISYIDVRGNESPIIRTTVSYNDGMGSADVEEIHTMNSSGVQLVVPIENQNTGGYMNEFPKDSYSPFSLSEDGQEIFFSTYLNDTGSSTIKEIVISKMTDQGYDKDTVVDLRQLSHRSDIWGYWSSSRYPEVTMMISGLQDHKILLGLNYKNEMSSIVANPEIVEVDILSGDFKILSIGRLDYSYLSGSYISDDFSTLSMFFPNGIVKPPKAVLDSDSDGLPDEVEIAAGMDPYNSDKNVIDAVYNYFFTQEGTAVKSLQKSTPYTNSWYYQPEIGWMWTNPTTYPYIYRSSSHGKSAGWMYFKEHSSNPIKMYDYSIDKWLNLGD